MKSKSIYFDMKDAYDMGLFASLVSSLQFNGVKFGVERDDNNICLTIG
jgi:hypothetical protein